VERDRHLRVPRSPPSRLRRTRAAFCPSLDLASRPAAGALSFEQATSWADFERDVTAWLGNRLQQAAHERLYRLRETVQGSDDPGLVEGWRRLTTSDHLYYMCTKWFADGDVHKYFGPYDTPYDAFVTWMNVAQDLSQRLALPAGGSETARAGVLAGVG
jgi:alpha-amylase